MEHFTAVREAINITRECRDRIKAIEGLPDAFRTRMLRPLTLSANAAANMIGDPIEESQDAIESDPNVGKPLTALLGKQLLINQDKAAKADVTQDQIETFKNRINMLAESVGNMSAKDMRDNWSDDELRGVAKVLGLPVTYTEPERMTMEWILKIQEAFEDKKNFEAKKAEVDSELLPEVSEPVESENEPAAEADRKDGAVENTTKVEEEKPKGKPGRKPADDK